VLADGRYTLYQVPDDPVVSLVDAWSVVKSGSEALRTVTAPGFDPRTDVVLQQDPGITEPAPEGGGTGAGGSVSYRRPSSQQLMINVRTPVASLLVVHDSFESSSTWTYSIDGSSSRPVLAADYFLQGVPVPPGHHSIVLQYTDPKVGQSLLASAIAWGAFLATLAAAAVVSSRRKRSAATERPVAASP
jgi:hypothetical protein